MRLQSTDYGFDAELPDVQEESSILQSAHLFNILSDGIYTDKILAVVREPVSNAYDAHVVAKKPNVQFKIKPPSRLDPTFMVEDEGTGIDPAKFKDVYFTYGKSTKQKSNDTIGALGLGCKSPLAYTKSSFVVKNRWNGTEHIYLLFLNKTGIPALSTVSVEPTASPNGVTVEFAVRTEDIYAFHNRIDRFFRYWDKKPIVVGDHTTEQIFKTKVIKVIQGTGWFLEHRDGLERSALAIQGNVPYPISYSSIPNLPEDLKIIVNNPFVIKFDMGTLGFTASREALSYDEFTNKNLVERLSEVREELRKSFEAKVFKKGMTQIEFMKNFRTTYNGTTSSLHCNDAAMGKQHEWALQLLLGKTGKDSVKYDGFSYKIDDLINGIVTIEVPEYLPYNVIGAEVRGRVKQRTYLAPKVNVTLSVTKECEGSDFFERFEDLVHPAHTQSLKDGKVKKGESWEFAWKSQLVSPRAKFTNTYDCALVNIGLCSVESQMNFKVRDGFKFIVNDVGNSGETRFKLLCQQESLLVTFNHKETTTAVVVKELNKLIEAHGLRGAEVVMLSSMPDMREPGKKIVKPAGTVKIKTIKGSFGSKQMADVGYGRYVNVHQFYSKEATDEIFALSDLQAMKQVVYVIKNRSGKTYYDRPDTHQMSIIHHRETMAIANKLGFFADVESHPKSKPGDESIRIFAINPGTIEWLKKRKVNLVTLRDLMTDQIVALQAAENFTAVIERSIVLEEVNVIGRAVNMLKPNHSRAKQTLTNPKSEIGILVNEYLALKKLSLDESFVKLSLLETMTNKGIVNNGGAARKIEKKIDKIYPMLSMISNVYDDDKIELICDYIDAIDKGVAIHPVKVA